MRIGTVFYVYVFDKVFDLIENIFHGGDRVIVHFAHLPFEIADLAQRKFSICGE